MRPMALRSIPACTGKPETPERASLHCWVYPRMYGETRYPSSMDFRTAGLSPHVRGNPRFRERHNERIGSIPACTGKPNREGARNRRCRVYPRMYGETPRSHILGTRGEGLSPHVRGNRGSLARRHAIQGSIPACTGKPACAPAGIAGARVYPRMYGETAPRGRCPCDTTGLSPHVRGNHHQMRRDEPRRGSIPACTGKPPSDRRIAASYRVYPRMYGETS